MTFGTPLRGKLRRGVKPGVPPKMGLLQTTSRTPPADPDSSWLGDRPHDDLTDFFGDQLVMLEQGVAQRLDDVTICP